MTGSHKIKKLEGERTEDQGSKENVTEQEHCGKILEHLQVRQTENQEQDTQNRTGIQRRCTRKATEHHKIQKVQGKQTKNRMSAESDTTKNALSSQGEQTEDQENRTEQEHLENPSDLENKENEPQKRTRVTTKDTSIATEVQKQ